MVSTRDDASVRADVWRTLEVELDPSGRIVDFINPSITRVDGPEERVRQHYARVLVEEYGYPKDRIAFEVPINIGRDRKFADIAVFKSASAAAEKSQGQIELVIETKSPSEKDGLGQLTSYIFASSASGGIWFNLDVAYFRRIDSPAPELRQWSNVPRLGETWDAVGHYRKDQLRRPVDLKRVFQRCHNAVYRSGDDSEDIALDMVRIILAKYRDEQNPSDLCEFRCAPDEFQTKDGRDSVALRVRSLFDDVVSDHSDVFPVGEQITMSNDNISVVVSELQPFKFLVDDDAEHIYDVIGTAFEVYVSSHLKGARGQYFTNRLVVNMMVEIMDPDERDIIYDPACGSGGFLIAALRHVRNRILKSGRSSTAKAREIRNASQRLYGTDIAPKLVRVAKTNMILNGDGHGGIVHCNALGDIDDKVPRTFPVHSQAVVSHRPTCILMNPPFGASYDLRERSRPILESFDLGHVWEASESGWLRRTALLNSAEGVPPELLFLERAIRVLAPGGKIGIVIARGVLDNRDAIAAREYILQHCKLLGVINCHPNTFAPFNGTKASIILLEKKKVPGFARDEDYPVFMAISQKVGQDSMGREIHRRNDAGELVLINGQPVVDHDLNEILAAWRDFRSGASIEYEGAWFVPLSRIVDETERRMNPVRFAPAAEEALGLVLELADSPDWAVERLGDFARVFNGPRFKRPFADEGVTGGAGIVKMYTPRAFFEERGESVKYLDRNKASRVQLKQLDVLTLESDWILVVDSGTSGKLLGKVGMTTSVHGGSVGNNNLIRIVIDDEIKRDYVYRFLLTPLGQSLLMRNVYGTNQDHIEPEDVKNIPIPVPKDSSTLVRIHKAVREIGEIRERAAVLDAEAREALNILFDGAISQSGGNMAELTAEVAEIS